MPFLSEAATKAVETTPGYLSPSKIQDGGSVRFALLSSEPLEFYEVWGTSPDGKQNKPFRFAYEPTPEDIYTELGDFVPRTPDNKPGAIDLKFAIAIPCYNYEAGLVQVMTLTQKSIIREVDAISQEEDYADLTAIDFTISKKGSGLKSEYKLRPMPRKKGSNETIAAAWEDAKAAGFDLSRLLTGGNPFKAE